MAKTKRGRALWSLPSRGRGTCPVCSSTRIKLLYARTAADGTQLKVCKKCFKAEQGRIDAVSQAR
ncbi:hypothetical protein G8C92_27835 [Paenibacillus donghaensis]|uniref:hypothetical protein n=1 Tax=Paenibacillus donghaensis TaxID=414771 RepID=UPI0018837770|nr:hypothetical protein [Paenibacillus donghaensis]MBE9917816.1 hypothetical protein [Paenibacillus donghaensis]